MSYFINESDRRDELKEQSCRRGCCPKPSGRASREYGPFRSPGEHRADRPGRSSGKYRSGRASREYRPYGSDRSNWACWSAWPGRNARPDGPTGNSGNPGHTWCPRGNGPNRTCRKYRACRRSRFRWSPRPYRPPGDSGHSGYTWPGG